MDYVDRVFEILESYADLGVRVLDHGTRLIGHVPHVAPEAWFHEIHAPLSAFEIAQLESDLGIEFPKVYADFLQRTNGLGAFSNHLYLTGLRKSFTRKGEGVWQPFSIRTANDVERPRKSKPSYLFVGGYEPDGSLLYIDTASDRVYRCSERVANPLHEWPSFEIMLETEVRRLSTLFDRAGRRLYPDRPTTP